MLGPIYGATITPQRPTSDGLGNLTFADLTPIDNVVVALDGPSSTEDSVYADAGSIYVPRGSDIANGDRVPYQGRNFVVIGEPLWDMNHPLTNDDFGYIEVKIQWGG